MVVVVVAPSNPGQRAKGQARGGTTRLDLCATARWAGSKTAKETLVALFHGRSNQLRTAPELLLGWQPQMAARLVGLTGGGARQGRFLGRRICQLRLRGCHEQWGVRLLGCHETRRPRQRYDWGQDRSMAPGGGFVCRLTLFPGAVDSLALASLFVLETVDHPTCLKTTPCLYLHNTLKGVQR